MARLKGIQPLYVLIGLMVCVVVLIIVFKLLGQFQAFEYEQQADITTKNLQTVMNQVCVTGETQTVSVNFPQKLSNGGLASDPMSLTKSVFTGNTAEVADSLRYMAALDSYGDPWYVVYFEDFPKGEDSGWQGWSTIAAQRGSSFYFTGIGMASCMVPMVGEFTSLGSRLVKGSLKVEEYAGEYQKSKYLQDLFDMFAITRESPILKTEMLKDLARDIISSAKGGYKGSIGKVIERFEIVSDTNSLSYITKHLNAVKKVDESLPEMETGMRSLKEGFTKTDPGARDAVDSVLKHISDLRTNTQYSEKDYQLAVENLVNGGDIKKIYEGSSNLMDKDLPSIKLILQSSHPSTDYKSEVAYLDKLVDRVSKGGEITENDVRLVKYITEDPITHETISGAEDFVKTVENTQELQANVNDIKAVSGSLSTDAKYPISYSKDYLAAAQSGTSGIPKLSAYASMVGAERMTKGVAQNAVMREGRWVANSQGYSFIFNGAVVSPLQQAQLKFSPCSGDSLCMKSAVNPSINVYPLDDCKAAGVDYVELDKTPVDANIIGGSASAATVSALNSIGSFMTGDKVTSKFYTASPCSGKLQIEKTKCDCEVKEVPYIDPSSIDSFIIKCKTGDWKDDGTNTGGTVALTCNLSKNMTYIGDSGEIISLAKGIHITAKYVDHSQDQWAWSYDISFDFADPVAYPADFGLDNQGKPTDVWTYFGSYYKDLSDASQNPPKDMQAAIDSLNTGGSAKFSLPCEFPLLSNVPNQEFECDPISLPAIPFTYHTCDTDTSKSDWLKCGKWVANGETQLVKDSVDKQTKVDANVWCCLQWGISKYEDPASAGAEVISVPSCELYPAKEENRYDKYPDVKVTEEVIKNNLNCAYGNGDKCITILPDAPTVTRLKAGDKSVTFSASKGSSKLTNGIAWSANPKTVCSIADSGGTATLSPLAAGDCVIKVHYEETGGKNVLEAIYTQKIEEATPAADPGQTGAMPLSSSGSTVPIDKDKADAYLKETEPKVWVTVSTSYSIALPKQVLSSDGTKTTTIDETLINGELGKLYWYNLPPTTGASGDCLKVKYVKDEGKTDETSGFCYTSPTAWADAKSIGWIVAASVVDVGSQVAIGALTGGAGTVSMVGTAASCLASNYVMWYGEQAVSKEKQQSYWPNSVYFKSYFT